MAPEHSRLPSRARVVVIGGGVVGASVAYHLARLGWSDVLLLERNTLTSGTTWHAAGLITQARGTVGTRRIVQDSLEVFHDLEREVGVGFRTTGTIHLATTYTRWEELQRQASVMRGEGIETINLSTADVVDRFPLLNPDGVVGGVLHPLDGRGNAADTTIALAKGAKAAGVTVLEHIDVLDVTVANGRVTGVTTSEGDVEADHVVNCAGLWGRSFAERHGVNLPLQALAHYYIVTDAVPGLSSGLPTIKSSDDCAYVRDEGEGLMVGFFEPGSSVWHADELATDEGFITMPGEWGHLEPYFERLAERFPVLGDVGVRLFFCGPESFTPDGHYHLGPVGSVGHYWAATGFNSVGFLSGPGAGRYLARWIVEGRAPFAMVECDPRRVLPHQANRAVVESRSLETLDLSYGIHWPFEQRVTARGLRRSPVHHHLRDRGAVFGEVAGWERANWFARDGVEPAYRYSFSPQNWFGCSAEEHRAVRERVGLFDLSSFGKLLVEGPDALALLEFICANRIDVADGRVVYTQMLNDRGGIESDVTVARLGEERFLLLTAAASTQRDLMWLRRHSAERTVWIHDASNAWAMFSVMGPRARNLLAELTPAALDNESFPFGSTAEIDLGLARARATRLTYVGELGWELLVPVESGAYALELLLEAGEHHDLSLCGYHALNSLRMEKAYRSWSHDIGPDDTPLEAGLGFAVAWDKPGGFLGRDGLLRQRESGPTRRLVQFLLDDPEPLLYHDEPVFRDGRQVGQVASASFGHTLGASVALAYVSDDGPVTSEWLATGRFDIEIGERRFGATGSLRPLYDPTSSRPKD